MSTGQVLLTLAAVVLLAYISLNIQRMYVQSVNNTIDSQYTSDALNFGRDLSDRIQSYAFNYDQLMNDFEGLDDVTDSNSRLEFTTQIGEIFFATVSISDETELIHEQTGRKATIRVYEYHEPSNEYRLQAEYVTAIAEMNN
jgi:hypothetical protein